VTLQKETVEGMIAQFQLDKDCETDRTIIRY